MAGGPLYVIQQHDATTRHFDLRLEVDGVLRSWAVPKGPSTDPRTKRLAVQVGDHDLDHGRFEGRTGPGGRGTGAVIVWDTGTYRPLGEGADPAAALRAGHLSFWVEGEKLRGGYTLQRTGEDGPKAQWLLVKRRDEHADAGRDPVADEPASVLSGRTIEEVGAR